MDERHPDRGRLLAYLDDETDAEGREAVRGHLEECPTCRRRAEELESCGALFSDAADRLDRPMPEIPNPTAVGSGAAALPPLRAAAVVLLLLAGGALLTPPGRALAERALGGITDLFREEPAAPVAVVREDTAREGQSTAVSASASGGRLRLIVRTPESGAGVLRLGSRAGGRALVEGTLRDVERGPGLLRVRVDALEAIRVRLPDSVGTGEVVVDGRTVLRQRGRAVTPAVEADTVDGEILLRVEP